MATFGSRARFALRIRVNMSEIGSFMLPACLGDARDEAVESAFAESEARAAELAQVAAAASAHGAAIDDAHRAGVFGQLGKRGVVFLGFQFGAESGVFFYGLALFIVSFNPGDFGHLKSG